MCYARGETCVSTVSNNFEPDVHSLCINCMYARYFCSLKLMASFFVMKITKFSTPQEDRAFPCTLVVNGTLRNIVVVEPLVQLELYSPSLVFGSTNRIHEAVQLISIFMNWDYHPCHGTHTYSPTPYYIHPCTTGECNKP